MVAAQRNGLRRGLRDIEQQLRLAAGQAEAVEGVAVVMVVPGNEVELVVIEDGFFKVSVIDQFLLVRLQIDRVQPAGAAFIPDEIELSAEAVEHVCIEHLVEIQAPADLLCLPVFHAADAVAPVFVVLRLGGHLQNVQLAVIERIGLDAERVFVEDLRLAAGLRDAHDGLAIRLLHPAAAHIEIVVIEADILQPVVQRRPEHGLRARLVPAEHVGGLADVLFVPAVDQTVGIAVAGLIGDAAGGEVPERIIGDVLAAAVLRGAQRRVQQTRDGHGELCPRGTALRVKQSAGFAGHDAAGRNGADGRLFVGRKRVDIRQLPVVDGLQGLRRALCQQIGKRSAAERAGEGRFILRAVGRQKGVRPCVGERWRVPGFFFARRRDALAGVLRVQTRGDRDGLRPADRPARREGRLAGPGHDPLLSGEADAGGVPAAARHIGKGSRPGRGRK